MLIAAKKAYVCVGVCLGEAGFNLSQNWGTDSSCDPTNNCSKREQAKNEQRAVK